MVKEEADNRQKMEFQIFHPAETMENDITGTLSGKPMVSEKFCMPVKRDSQPERMSGYTKNGQPDIAVCVGLSTFDKASLQVAIAESIAKIINEFDFCKESGLLQFWACTPFNSEEDIGCNLMLTNESFISTQDAKLRDYRRRCLENRYRSVGLETSVGNWLAGRAAQTGIADHRTKHHVVNQQDQHSADIGGMGQLVVPVFYDQGAGCILVGIIEFVTPVPKESYVEDFEHIHNLLKDEGLKSNYMGKVIRVKYDYDMIKFTLPLSAKLTDLQREVTKRFTELKHQKFRIEYDDTEGNRLPISSDDDLGVCMDESSLKGAKFIRMCVLLET